MQDETSLRALLVLLSNTSSGDSAARALARAVLHDLSPVSTALHVLHGSALELAGAFGVTPARRRLLATLPSDAPVPEQLTLAAGEPIAYSLLALRATPLHRHLECGSTGTTICVPIRLEGRAIGLLTIQAAGDPPFDAALQRRLDGVAAALALWIGCTGRITGETQERPLLSQRQQRIIDGIRRGLTNAAIAAELGFAVGTIKADITAMSALLGASGRTDLLARVQAAQI